VCLSLTTALGDETEKKKSIERESAKKKWKNRGARGRFWVFLLKPFLQSCKNWRDLLLSVESWPES
jgi:hypothetical protein